MNAFRNVTCARRAWEDHEEIHATLCDRWEPIGSFVDSAPMGGMMCIHCQRVAEARIDSNQPA